MFHLHGPKKKSNYGLDKMNYKSINRLVTLHLYVVLSVKQIGTMSYRGEKHTRKEQRSPTKLPRILTLSSFYKSPSSWKKILILK